MNKHKSVTFGGLRTKTDANIHLNIRQGRVI